MEHILLDLHTFAQYTRSVLFCKLYVSEEQVQLWAGLYSKVAIVKSNEHTTFVLEIFIEFVFIYLLMAIL